MPQNIKRLFIEHTSFSQYKFLWSLSNQKKHGVVSTQDVDGGAATA